MRIEAWFGIPQGEPNLRAPVTADS